MANIILATSLMRFAGNQKKFDCQGSTLGEALSMLCKKNTDLSKFIYKNPDELHPFINIYINEKNIRDLQGIDTTVHSDTTVRILPGVSGG